MSLTASTAASVTVTSPEDDLIEVPGPAGPSYARTNHALERVTVINHDSANSVYYRFDGINPTVKGDDTYALPPSGAWTHDIQQDDWTVVLISAGTPDVSVVGESS